MLLVKIQETEDIMKKFKNINNLRQRVKRLEKLKTDVDKLKQQIYKSIEVIEAISKENKDLVKFNKDLLVRNINKLIDDMNCGIDLTQDNIQYLQNNLENQMKNIEVKWKEYIDKKINVQIQSAKLINKLFRNEIIQRNIYDLEIFKNKWPITLADVNQINLIIKKLNNELEKLNLDDEIKNFLYRLLAGNATLLDITPKINAWLETNKILDKIKIGI